MDYQYRLNVFQEVQEISADVADLKAILAKMLAVQEKQQESLAAIAACLEKISGAMTNYSGQPALLTFITNSESCRG
jgi:hypothetical protein